MVIIEHTGSSAGGSSHGARRSVKDRLGQGSGKTGSQATPSDALRRKLVFSSNTGAGGSFRSPHGGGHSTIDQRETIRKRKLQEAQDTMKALQKQQEDLQVILSELQGDDDRGTMVRGSRETTPQSWHQRRRVNDPPTSQVKLASDGVYRRRDPEVNDRDMVVRNPRRDRREEDSRFEESWSGSRRDRHQEYSRCELSRRDLRQERHRENSKEDERHPDPSLVHKGSDRLREKEKGQRLSPKRDRRASPSARSDQKKTRLKFY